MSGGMYGGVQSIVDNGHIVPSIDRQIRQKTLRAVLSNPISTFKNITLADHRVHVFPVFLELLFFVMLSKHQDVCE